MRALVLTLMFSLAATPLFADSTVAMEKLAALRQQKQDLANRHRAAILIVNETPVAGIDAHLHNEAAVLFSSKGHEIVNHPDSAAIVAAHTKGQPFTVEELQKIADQLQVETVAVGTVKDYRAKKDVGIPLPTMYIRTEARVKMDGLIYKRSANQIVWTDTQARVNRQFVGGTLQSRGHTRMRTSETVIDALFNRYFNKKG